MTLSLLELDSIYSGLQNLNNSVQMLVAYSYYLNSTLETLLDVLDNLTMACAGNVTCENLVPNDVEMNVDYDFTIVS